MQHPGTVKTHRGAVVDFNDLRMKAKKPINSNVDHKDKVHARKEPPRVINTRGFVPSMDGVTMRSGSKHELTHRTDPVFVQEEEDPMTLADMTGVIVEKPANGISKGQDTAEILKDIIDIYPKGRKLDDTSRRRTKQS